MGDVQDELDRGMLETGVAVITPEMTQRDAWRALRQHIERGYQVEGRTFAEAVKAFAAAEMPGVDPVTALALGLANANPRTTPARPLRVRVCLDPVDGPAWLGLLAQCAWLRGGIVGTQA